MKTKTISTAGLIAALYTVIALVLAPFSFGVYQVRVSEALTVLPFLTPAAIPGLFVGCVLANIFGGMGWQDIVFGSLITLAAAFMTRGAFHLYRGSKSILWKYLAPLPPVVLNAFGVAWYLAPIIGTEYWFTVQMVGLGQLVSCYVLGLPLLLILEKRKVYFFN